MLRQTKLWMFSIAVAFLLVCVQVYLWTRMNTYIVPTPQLVSAADVEEYLDKNWVNVPHNSATASQPMLTVKTGVFIQSLKFFSSSEVNLSGYIWQHYIDGIHDSIKPDSGDVGFILPEQVNSGSDIEPKEMYRIHQNNETVIGWYFEATIRQPFDYLYYPFDHKTVWLRLWPRDFAENVILTPDFSAYDSTGELDTFGIENEIVLGTWDRANTYFDYKLTTYDTDFGIADYVGMDGFPELYYNFVIKRRFENAFIVYLLPLFLVAALLFGALLTLSRTEGLADRHGFNTSTFLGATSALFFVVLLAHIQLREQFAGSEVVYIEYFYILMYLVLVLANGNAYFFSVDERPWLKLIHYHDNLIPKLIYWPLLLSAAIAITLWVMWRYAG